MQLFLTDPLLDGLNDQQQEAVQTIKGPVQLVASAGSGKTTVLTRRIAYMLNNGIKPESIMAVTFTRKAADEMESRLKKLVANKKIIEKISIGTYHSLCLEMLKNNYQFLGFSQEKAPAICLENRQRTILKQIINDFGSPFLVEEALTVLGQIKNLGIYPEEFNSMVNGGQRPIQSVNEEELPVLGKVYDKYQKYFVENNIIDYDDILMLTRKLLQTNPEIRTKLQNSYHYLLVDEFQDVNKVQYDITSLLAAPHNNFFVVGDDAQSIYAFRGSDVNIIINFCQDYPDTKIIKLENNYRSTPEIIDLSNKLIAFNRNQITKTVRSTNKSLPESVNFSLAEEPSEESFNVGKQIKGFLLKGIKPEEIAILYRSHTQAAQLEEDLIAWNIPYTIHRNGSFYDLPEIQDAFSFLHLARNENTDADEGLERVFRFWGITGQTADILRTYAKNNEINLFEACLCARSIKINPGQISLLERLVQNILRWQKIKDNLNVADLLENILESSGYIKKLEQKGTESATNSINNLSVLHERAKKWECKSITDFFRAIEQQEIKRKEKKGKKQAVQLMTIHTSKGMEFEVVFLIGLEEEILPHKKSVIIGNISEERRLCYVAITRAKKYLLISRTDYRSRFGKRYQTVVSRFWQEMNDQVEV